MARLRVLEATQAGGGTKSLTGEKMLIRLIDAGQGSSGYYPADTLEAAATANVFPAGTQMYIDHPGEMESVDRPERTLRDLAAVLDEDAYYDPDTQSLVAEATVFKSWRETIKEMKDNIGVSIRAFAEFDGNVVTKLIEALSVDFVTMAGRGGKVLEILEARRPVSESLESQFAERLGQAVANVNPEMYVRDYDTEAATAYIYSWQDQKYYATSFEDSGTEVTLSGSLYEVYPETHYVRVGNSAESKESEVADTNLELVTEAKAAAEAKVAALEAKVTALESENETLKTEKAESVKKANEAQAASILDRVLNESELPDVTKAKIRSGAVVGDDFDSAAFEAMLNDEIKREGEYLAEALGSKITGFGKESTIHPQTGFKSAWGREIK